MEKHQLFNGFVGGEYTIALPANELVTQEIETIEEKLIELGAQIKSYPYYSPISIDKITLGKYIFVKPSDLFETTVIIPGLDGFPLYIVLKQIGNIFFDELPEVGKITSIVWKGGGSIRIDNKFYAPLKKYWLKKRKLISIVELDSEDPKFKEILNEEKYLELSKKIEQVISLKIEQVNQQNFEKAARYRDQEKELLKEIEPIEGEMMKKFDEYCKNHIESIKQQIFTEA
jgi:hypothetical protein